MKRPLVVVSAIVYKQGRVLLGVYKTKHKMDKYATPGGKVDEETLEECFWRELKEETGLEKPNSFVTPHFIGMTEEIATDGSRFLVLHYGFPYTATMGEVINTEPEKCAAWEWLSLNEMKDRFLVSSVEKLVYNHNILGLTEPLEEILCINQ